MVVVKLGILKFNIYTNMSQDRRELTKCDLQQVCELLKDLPVSGISFQDRAKRSGDRSQIVGALRHFLRIWGAEPEGRALIFAAVGKGFVLGKAASSLVAPIRGRLRTLLC